MKFDPDVQIGIERVVVVTDRVSREDNADPLTKLVISKVMESAADHVPPEYLRYVDVIFSTDPTEDPLRTRTVASWKYTPKGRRS